MEIETGNVLQEKQQTMVQTRLKKRISDVGLITPGEYYKYFQDNKKTETEKLVSIITTHHTYFFRETLHFDFIINQLDVLVARLQKENRHTLNVFCGACSRGHEVYTLGLFLNKHLKQYPGIDFKIYASDIDPECVEFAKKGTPNSINNPTWKEFGDDENYQILDIPIQQSNKSEFEFCTLFTEQMRKRAFSD